jgi:CyaY protein
MNEQDYYERATSCLARVARWVDQVNDDGLDVASQDGLVALEFDDGTKYVLNRQSGNHQMWFAAGARAWHYDWNGERWVDDRDGHRLEDRIVEVVRAKLGRAVAPIA